MAKSDFPQTLKHHGNDRERVVYTVADKVKAEFDGFSAGPKPKANAKAAAKAKAGAQPQDAAGDAGKSTTTPADKPGTTK